MKKLLIRTIFLMLVLYTSSQAQGIESRKFGIGFMIGSPTGISLKYWLNEVNALTGGISLENKGGIQINYLWHSFEAIRVTDGRLPIHYGFGAQSQFDDHTILGLRGVVGLTYIFERSPFDIFCELAPLLEIGNDAEFRLTASAGARYYF
ncbi:MAG TPA: hypothetical protein DCP53_08655 [Elusimicrobia bacterium]|nr:hypothetical protein [Elusimicrobiota bacterium]